MEKKLNSILLIDDDIPTNEYHKIVIEDTGLVDKVEAVTSGKEALDYLTNSGKYAQNGPDYPQPDLIFLDINMPAMNGFEFIEAYDVLEDIKKGKMVIFMLTTSLNPDDMERAKSYKNITGFYNKPLTEEILSKIVEKIQ